MARSTAGAGEGRFGLLILLNCDPRRIYSRSEDGGRRPGRVGHGQESRGKGGSVTNVYLECLGCLAGPLEAQKARARQGPPL